MPTADISSLLGAHERAANQGVRFTDYTAESAQREDRERRPPRHAVKHSAGLLRVAVLSRFSDADAVVD